MSLDPGVHVHVFIPEVEGSCRPSPPRDGRSGEDSCISTELQDEGGDDDRVGQTEGYGHHESTREEVEFSTVNPGGYDELFIGLSDVFEGERLEWMDRELCTGPYADARDTKCEEEKGVPKCRASADNTGEMQRMRKLRDHQRCQRGECCVHSMWYNPAFAYAHGSCSHVCRSTPQRASTCGPSVLTGSVLQILSEFVSGTDRPKAQRPRRRYLKSRNKKAERPHQPEDSTGCPEKTEAFTAETALHKPGMEIQ